MLMWLVFLLALMCLLHQSSCVRRLYRTCMLYTAFRAGVDLVIASGALQRNADQLAGGAFRRLLACERSANLTGDALYCNLVPWQEACPGAVSLVLWMSLPALAFAG